ncbi:Ribonuclease M [Vanrija pseudolonga]|uniref:Ribonuclease M n=1 Tax=Vanrija pseudolonga TaxID=143232 RepID=A0AAF0YIT0_9TREE|nr:Ribonuclease M [Vanrija pseudolonga]
MLALALLPLVSGLAAAATCSPDTVSCSPESKGADPCCVASAGLFVFTQRFEPDEGDGGAWSIDGLEVLECDGSPAKRAVSPRKTHEQIGSATTVSKILDTDAAERAWAQSEVGEGVEELWERSWNTAGRYVSTICDGDVSPFFAAVFDLHKSIPTAELLNNADISPSDDTTYALADIIGALSHHNHQPILTCDESTLVSVSWPLHAKGKLASFVPASIGRESSCPAEGIIYPPSLAVHATTTKYTFDPIHRPTMRPITLSHDESRQVKYDEAEEAKKAKKLGFFKGKQKGSLGRKDEL